MFTIMSTVFPFLLNFCLGILPRGQMRPASKRGRHLWADLVSADGQDCSNFQQELEPIFLLLKLVTVYIECTKNRSRLMSQLGLGSQLMETYPAISEATFGAQIPIFLAALKRS